MHLRDLRFTTVSSPHPERADLARGGGGVSVCNYFGNLKDLLYFLCTFVKGREHADIVLFRTLNCKKKGEKGKFKCLFERKSCLCVLVITSSHRQTNFKFVSLHVARHFSKLRLFSICARCFDFLFYLSSSLFLWL